MVSINTRHNLCKALPFLSIFATSFMIWKSLSVVTNTTKPVVVVISESMAPAFHRGDILLLWNRQNVVHVGDIPVVWFPGNPLPMVHRAIGTFYAEGTASQLILTKGDNNNMDDTSLYPSGQSYVFRDESIGMVKAYVPYLGWVTIFLNDYSWLKGVLVAILLALAIFS